MKKKEKKMKTKNFEAVIEENGMIQIPEEVLKDMLLVKGDSFIISYPCPTEAMEYCMRIESSLHEDEDSDGYLCIPKELLKQCGMVDKKVHMICFNEEITITTSDKLCELVPEAIMQIFKKHGISAEEVAQGIAEQKEII